MTPQVRKNPVPKEPEGDQEGRTKKAGKDLEPVLTATYTGADIGFYRPFSGGIHLFEQFYELDEYDLAPENRWDLNFSAITKEELDRPRRTERIDPDQIYFDRAREFLKFAEENISSKRENKLDFVEKVLAEPEEVDFDTAVHWFEKRDKMDFDQFNESVMEENLGLGKDEKVLEQTIDQYWDDLKENEEIDDRDRVQRGLMLDLTKTLQSIAFQKDEDFKETVDDYELFLRRFQPEMYRDVVENDHEYEVLPLFKERKNHALVKSIGSCLAKDRYEDFRDQHIEDPFTFVHAIGRDGKLQGYMRSFVMEDDKDNKFLGMDTIEIPKRGGMDLDDIREVYEENKDVLQAGVLGLMEMGEKLGVEYIAGRDARVNFGLRQPYSNTQKKITYRKIGDAVPYYSVAKKEVKEELARYVPDRNKTDIESMKNELEEELKDREDVDWNEVSVEMTEPAHGAPYHIVAYGKKKKKVPGFEEFPNPEEQDLRGFRTEEGWHTNHAYILMEYPG